MDFEQAQATKQAVVMRERIVLDGEWADEVAKAQNDVRRLTNEVDMLDRFAEAAIEEVEREKYFTQVADKRGDLEEAQERVDALVAQSDEKTIEFTFHGLSPSNYDKLVMRHRPTPEQRQEAKRNNMQAPQWNVDTFPPALIARCLVSPAWTEEQVASLWSDDNWNPAELQSLFQAADRCVGARKVVDLGEG